MRIAIHYGYCWRSHETGNDTRNNLAMISKSVGGDRNAVKSALRLGLPMIMGSMANTASEPGGAETLTKMLSQGAASNPMDNLGGFLANPAAAGAPNGEHAVREPDGHDPERHLAKDGTPPHGSRQGNGNSGSPGHRLCRQMFVSQKMDTKSLTTLLGDESKMAMQASPDATAMAQQLMGAQESSGGVSGILKKVLGK